MAGRTALLALAAIAAVSTFTGASAQPYPNKPIRFIVPFPAGGSTDVAARLVGEYLSRSLGQQVFVENKTGANGNIGIETAAKSAPDGYTVLVTADAVASNPHVYTGGIDPTKDLLPVIHLSRQPIVLAAHPSLGINSLAELVALAKQQPGLRYATGSGVNSAQHMAIQWFGKIAGISMEQVPYRGGGQAINDLIGAHIKLGSLGSTPLIPHYKAGTLRLLGADDQGSFAKPARRADVRGGGNDRAGARPMARCVRPCRHAARHYGAAQQRDRQGAGRSGDPQEPPRLGAGADRRHDRVVRAAHAR